MPRIGQICAGANREVVPWDREALPVSEHVRDQPNGITSRLSSFRPYPPGLFVEAIKIAVAIVPHHSLAETQAQQPLIKLFAVGFSWLAGEPSGHRGCCQPRKSAWSTSLMACGMLLTFVIPTALSYFSLVRR